MFLIGLLPAALIVSSAIAAEQLKTVSNVPAKPLSSAEMAEIKGTGTYIINTVSPNVFYVTYIDHTITAQVSDNAAVIFSIK